MPRVLWGSNGGGCFLVSEVPLQSPDAHRLCIDDLIRAIFRHHRDRRTPLGPYSRSEDKSPMVVLGGGRILMSEVPLTPQVAVGSNSNPRKAYAGPRAPRFWGSRHGASHVC